MLHVDGSMGEGGGQVLRTALGLSLVTGQPFVIDRIRAGREKPGLARQHLTAVLAAAEIGAANVDGAVLGSQRVRFQPTAIHTGSHRFAIGTAGSTTLVLQTVLPALLEAREPTTLQLSGGTHNPLAPSFDFLARVFAPVLRAMGVGLELRLGRHGFAPAGGGTLQATITPARLQPIELFARRTAGPRLARALVAQLHESIAERQLRVVQQRLGFEPEQLRIEAVEAAGPGNVLLIEFPGDPVGELIAAHGERRLTAEQVADRACDEAAAFLHNGAPVGEHLADQLLIPLALAGGGAFRTLPPSRHARTNAEVIERFLPVRFTMREDVHPAQWIIAVEPRS